MKDSLEDFLFYKDFFYHYLSASIVPAGLHDHMTRTCRGSCPVFQISLDFEQFENVKDFINDFSPISRELFFDFMNKLDEFDRKGYFQFMKEFGRVMDNVVVSFSVKDVKHLSENVVTILNTVKNLTQPEMLNAVNNALKVYKNLDVDVSEKVSVFTLVKELNKPEVKKGLAFGLKFLENLGKQEFQNQQLTVNKIQSN